MPPPLHFAFVLHNHQPVGQLPEEFDRNYAQAYRPFLDVVERFPGVRLGLHISGVLLDWLWRYQPDYVARLQRLVDRGQVEILTGGHYEPMLALLPDRDKHGQIRRLTQRIEELFGLTPRGLWLAERVWEPHLARPLAEAGVAYTLLDSILFEQLGLAEEETFGYFLTEEQGATVGVFPINQTVRQAIPFESPEAVLELLRARAAEGPPRLVVFADDGEKFGGWPKTHQTCYGEGWLERFCTLLQHQADWLHLTTLGDWYASQPARGLIYLPTGSYQEMLAWSGGYWRNFLRRYEEANWMHKRMLLASEHVGALAAQLAATEPDDPRRVTLQEAQEALWKGQCNCGYWHGVFGGLYLKHIRGAVYRNLLRAEKQVETAEDLGTAWVVAEEKDLDRDGQTEVLLRTPRLLAVLAPARGGALVELDERTSAWNLLATLRRRREAYHTDEDRAPVDWYPRAALLDHFLHPDTTLASFQQAAYGEQGDFVTGGYDREVYEDETQAVVRLARRGQVWIGARAGPVQVEKSLILPAGAAHFRVLYHVTNLAPHPAEFGFGVESNLVLAGDELPQWGYRPADEGDWLSLQQTAAHEGVTDLQLRDQWLPLSLALTFTVPAGLWHVPIHTLSRAVTQLERAHQCSAFLAHWPLSLGPGERWEMEMRWVLAGD